MRSVRVGVVGYGHWGPNIVRTLSEMPDVTVAAVADRSEQRLNDARWKHPRIELVVQDHRELFELDLDAVMVATPPETHFSIVREFLARGIDIFVEKPLATNSEDAAQMMAMADRLGRVLMVGHIAEYHPTVRALKRLIESGELGTIRYIDTVRAGLGLFHPSLNVLWDLAPHDISILIHLLGEAPTHASARGIACVQPSVEDVVYSTYTFPGGVLAHSRLSWLDPLKTRRITVVGSEKMAVYDDLEPHEKLKVYDKRVDAIPITDTFGDFQFSYHYGSTTSPYIELEEPLRVECRHFVDCVRTREKPLTDGANGVKVVQVIEAAQRSLQDGGTSTAVGEMTGASRAIPLRPEAIPGRSRRAVGDDSVVAEEAPVQLRASS